MTSFSPREIVSELDRFIIGQGDAKKAVAVALRNRWRRQQLDGAMREEVLPKNILMVGPTGVGKTEIFEVPGHRCLTRLLARSLFPYIGKIISPNLCIIDGLIPNGVPFRSIIFIF